MGSDYKHGSCGFEAYATLDADDGVADVHVSADAVCTADFFDSLDGSDLVIVFLAVNTADFAMLEFKAEDFASLLANLFEVCRLRKALL